MKLSIEIKSNGILIWFDSDNVACVSTTILDCILKWE